MPVCFQSPGLVCFYREGGRFRTKSHCRSTHIGGRWAGAMAQRISPSFREGQSEHKVEGRTKKQRELGSEKRQRDLSEA